MRLLYVASGYGSEHLGSEMHRELAQEIVARGHGYTVFAFTHARHFRAPMLVEDGFPVYYALSAGKKHLDLINKFTAPIFKFPWFLVALWCLTRFLRSHRRDFDLIIAEGVYPFGAIVYLATRLVPIPFVAYAHGADFIANREANYGYARFRLPRWLLRRVYRAARLLKAESPYGAASTIALGCPPEKMTLVHRNIGRACYLSPGLDLETYRARCRAGLAERYGLQARHLVLAVGRLLPIKGFDDLIRALPEIVARAGDTQVLFLGPNRKDTRLGDYQKLLQDLGNGLGVGNRLVFAGAVPYDQVRDLLAGADLVAVPSVQDSGNKLVMEAGAVATPFVATNTAGNALWAKEWDCGVIVEPRQPDVLAAAIAGVLNDPARARVMGLNGIRFADQFRPGKVAERTLWLCETALKNEPPPRELREFDSLLHPASLKATPI